MQFRLISENTPKGDQPEAIRQIIEGLNDGVKDQVLLGITGSGKTFTIANVIEKTQRPTLVLAHNKTLAAQLYQEFKTFFPENSVEYFVSYYDYYQPEAYVPAADLYIEKEATINEEIDRLRLSATRALFERPDVIVVASVSCIYGLGDPDAYFGMLIFIEPGMKIKREEFLQKLVELQYERVNIDFDRGVFRVRGATLTSTRRHWLPGSRSKASPTAGSRRSEVVVVLAPIHPIPGGATPRFVATRITSAVRSFPGVWMSCCSSPIACARR